MFLNNLKVQLESSMHFVHPSMSATFLFELPRLRVRKKNKSQTHENKSYAQPNAQKRLGALPEGQKG